MSTEKSPSFKYLGLVFNLYLVNFTLPKSEKYNLILLEHGIPHKT